MMSHEKYMIGLLVALVVCNSCATSDVQKPEEEDAAAVRAQMEVKAALLDEERVAAAPIRVEYESGSVRLTGFVETEAEKQRAAEVAKRAVPDLEVINDLRVWRPPDAGPPAELDLRHRDDEQRQASRIWLVEPKNFPSFDSRFYRNKMNMT